MSVNIGATNLQLPTFESSINSLLIITEEILCSEQFLWSKIVFQKTRSEKKLSSLFIVIVHQCPNKVD